MPVQTRRVVVKTPEVIPPADVTLPPIPNAQRLEVAGDVYEEVGVCAQCGEKVFKLVSGGRENTLGNALVVYVAHSSRERPGIYCQAHDPNIGHRMAAQTFTGVIPGDSWRPRA